MLPIEWVAYAGGRTLLVFVVTSDSLCDDLSLKEVVLI